MYFCNKITIINKKAKMVAIVVWDKKWLILSVCIYIYIYILGCLPRPTSNMDGHRALAPGFKHQSDYVLRVFHLSLWRLLGPFQPTVCPKVANNLNIHITLSVLLQEIEQTTGYKKQAAAHLRWPVKHHNAIAAALLGEGWMREGIGKSWLLGSGSHPSTVVALLHWKGGYGALP